jgi:hypothetical protein
MRPGDVVIVRMRLMNKFADVNAKIMASVVAAD